MKVALLATFSTVPRTFRMAKSLSKAGYNVHLLEWDRECERPPVEIIQGISMVRFRLKAPYTMKVFFLMPLWMMFVAMYVLIHDFEIVQPQNLDNLVSIWFVSKIKRIKIVYDLADYYRDAYLRNIPLLANLSSSMERFLARHVNALLLVSEGQIHQLRKENIPEKYSVIYNTPEINSFIKINREKNIISNEGITLLYAGVFEKERTKLLLNVISAVEQEPHVRLLLAGFGATGNFIRNVVRNKDNIIFLGKLNHDEILNYTFRSDVVILPYDSSVLNNKIALPNKLMEAMACSCAVIAPVDTYMAQIACNEKFGICVNFHNIEDIKQAISILRDNRILLNNMSEAAFDAYKKTYSQKSTEKAFLGIYREL